MTNFEELKTLTVGRRAFLADNLHWKEENGTTLFDDMIAGSQFPFCPDFMSMIICHKGTFTLRSKGTDYVAGPLDTMIILGGQLIEKVSISSDCRMIYFAGNLDSVGNQVDLDDVNHILRHAIQHDSPLLLHLSNREYKAAEKLYFSAQEFLEMSGPETRDSIIPGYARIVSALIAEKIGSQQSEEGDAPVVMGDRSVLLEFLSNVRANCRRERSIGFYASEAHLTPKYFSRIIKNVSGKSPGVIIREYTMAEAKALLSTKKYSVKEVSTMLNFSGPSSFGKYFKAAQGCSPGEYVRSGSEL